VARASSAWNKWSLKALTKRASRPVARAGRPSWSEAAPNFLM
jgi:hypothetical protein